MYVIITIPLDARELNTLSLESPSNLFYQILYLNLFLDFPKK